MRIELKAMRALLCLVALLMAGPAPAGERVRLELTGGDSVEGELLRRDDRGVLLLVGGEALRFAADRVRALQAVGAPERDAAAEQNAGPYATGQRSVRDVQSLVAELGEAVAVVKTPRGLGTGWFCSPDGLLVTNHHVVAGERTIRVTVFPRRGDSLGRKIYDKVRIVAVNAEMDLALLKIEQELEVDIPQLLLGDSRRVRVGDEVFAIGNPLGLERTTSQGIVSKVGRNIGGRLFLQTTAPIAPGNSGGPLFNDRGQVIGVISRGAVLLDGLGFAIPTVYVKEFLDNIEAFAYDEDNPNTGVAYLEPPISTTDGRIRFTRSDFVRVGHGLCCMRLVDLGDGPAQEVVFADNNKSEIGILRRRRSPPAAGEPDGLAGGWDINRLPASRRFQLDSIAVASRITSLAAGDLTGDGTADLVFAGQPGGLSLLAGRAGGGFEPVRRLADVEVVGHPQALQLVDLDGDRRLDLFVLGPDNFAVLWSGHRRRLYPLAAELRGKVLQLAFQDADGDGRLDVIFFVRSAHRGVTTRLQSAARRFDHGRPLSCPIGGPVEPAGPASHPRFLTLDAGVNRLRELRLVTGRADGGERRALISLPVASGRDPSAGNASGDVLDIDGDGADELLTVDRHRSEFTLIDHRADGFRVRRSPAPAGLAAFRLHRTAAGQAVVFSLSPRDALFGVGIIRDGRIAFPRPIHTAGEVQGMQLERLEGLAGHGSESPALIWFERDGGGQVVRWSSADGVARTAAEQPPGSVDVAGAELTFGPDPERQQARLDDKIERLAFAHFDDDPHLDAVIFWAYSGKESLYLGLGDGRFVAVADQQRLIDDEKDRELLVADVDGDGRREALQVQPGFVRLLRVDEKDRLYIARQLTWEHGRIEQLVAVPEDGSGAELIAFGDHSARRVRLAGAGGFQLRAETDLTGVAMGRLTVGDVDGDRRADLVGWRPDGAVVLLARKSRLAAAQRIALDADLERFEYWNLHTGELDGGARREVLLFDRRQAVIEILRQRKGRLWPVMRHRLYSSGLADRAKRNKKGSAQPRGVAIGDVDGDDRPDLIFAIHDRLAIYLQAGARAR
jgi:serine protease Do